MKRLHLLLLPLVLALACQKDKPYPTQFCSQKIQISPSPLPSDSLRIFIPNAFTPDKVGDLSNDQFYVTLPQDYTYRCRVYFGKTLLFETFNKYEGWDGKIAGAVTYGTFDYILNIGTPLGREFEIKGKIASMNVRVPTAFCQECRFSDQINFPHGFVNPTREMFLCAEPE